MTDVEPGIRIVGRHQHQLAIEQQVAVLAVHGRLFQAVSQNATDFATSLQGPAHGGLIDAFGTA
ncbi:hypothetical protein D3C76_1642150 [compost metagenome]